MASSASVESLSTYCHLFLLADVFTCLSFSLYRVTALYLRLGDLKSNDFFINYLLSFIALHVSGEIHLDLQVFVYPIVSLADSIIVVFKSSMVKAVSSWRMLKWFLSIMRNFSLMSVSFSNKCLAVGFFPFQSSHSTSLRSSLPQASLCHFQHLHFSYPHILKRASPFIIDDDMINLALASSVR